MLDLDEVDLDGVEGQQFPKQPKLQLQHQSVQSRFDPDVKGQGKRAASRDLCLDGK